MAFVEHEPLPERRADFRNAMLMTLFASINKGKRGKTPKLTDMLPDWWNDKRRPDALARKFRGLTANVTPTAEDTPND